MSFFTESVRRLRLPALILGALATGACDSNKVVEPPANSQLMSTLGQGVVGERYTGELWVRGNVAYTTTWGNRSGAPGNAVKIWDVSGNTPVLLDSLIVPNAGTLGDIQTSDDGTILVVATEGGAGSIMIYDLANPVKPQLITRYNTPLTDHGVHTAEVQRVNGTLYGFLSIDPGGGDPARLVIVDLSNPAVPTQVFTAPMGNPFMHDVFVRNGILFTALWNDGVTIWDIGGAGSGTVANPIALGNVRTVGGHAHNIWWYRSANGAMKYAFVGEEDPALGANAVGDVHVVDVSNLAAPKEVAVYSLPGAGTHNFSVDETRGILYAAYYNGGVRAIDVNGDLESCAAAEKTFDGRCDLAKMGREVAHGLVPEHQVYVWGVQFVNGSVFASDMLNGLWKLSQAPFGPD